MLSRELNYVSEEAPLFIRFLPRALEIPSLGDADRIAAVSPAKHAANIKIPVLLDGCKRRHDRAD